MRLFIVKLILLGLFLGALSCNKENEATAKMLMGRWELQEGFRNGEPTESLTDLFFEFGKEGRMETNLPLPEAGGPSTYAAEKQVIVQRQGGVEVEYQIEMLNDSVLIINTSMRNYDFRFVLRKK